MRRSPSSAAVVAAIVSAVAAPAFAQAPPPLAPRSPAVAPTLGDKTVAPQPPSQVTEPDPWAGRSDLFVPPDLKPTTKVTLGPVARSTTANGMQLMVISRRQVPSVEVTLALKLPETAEPIDKAGLASFTAQMLRMGTATRSAEQLSDAIDFVGGDLGAADGRGAIYVSCHARARDLALCMELVGDLAMHPSFPPDQMGEIRDRLQAQVNAVRDDPQTLASWHAYNTFYGDEDTRGRPMSTTTLNAIDRVSLVDFHDRWFAPNNAILAVSGDVDDKAVKALVAKTFGKWKQHPVPPIVEGPPKPMPAAPSLPVRLVDKPNATQSVLVLLGSGIKETDPSLYAVRLMNFALGGGGFSSRLMQAVRSEGGKTYHVSSSYDVGRQAGPFEAATFTRTAETTATLQLLREQIDKMRADGPTAEELRAAKANQIGGYGLRLETGADLASALLGAELDGLDRNFVADYPARLQAVTLEQTKRAAADKLDVRALVVVGQASQVGPMLKKAGYKSIEVVNYLEPISASERKAAREARMQKTAVSSTQAIEGRRLLDQAIKAHGGMAALDRIKTVAFKAHGQMTVNGQSMQVVYQVQQVVNQMEREEVVVDGHKALQVYAPKRSYMVGPDGKTVDMPADGKAEFAREMFRDPRMILVNALSPNVRLRAAKGETVGDKTYDVVEVLAADNDLTRVLLDPTTHRIWALDYVSDQGRAHDQYGDYRLIDGVYLAFESKWERGDREIELTYDKIEVNPTLDRKLFE